MKSIKMQNCSVNNVYSGVYKIIFPNNKIYIGISNNIYRRMLEHNSDFRNNLPIEKAIQKYGKITEFIILEEINPNDRELMREREKFWISAFNSNKKEFGYNISEGGDGADIGSNNSQAKLTEEQYQQVYKDLIDNKLSLQEIADKYEMHLSSLSKLNNGHTYFHSTVDYPIRKTKPKVAGINSGNSKFSQQDIEDILILLQFHPELSMKKIADKYSVYASTIQNINQGKTYINSNLTYPLRESKTGKRKLSNEQVFQIISEIKNNPKESLASIGRRLNISSKTISSINCGTIYRQDNENYPIR
jgi:group I intron endonuclease